MLIKFQHILLILFLFTTHAWSQNLRDNAVLVTDPNQIKSMGFVEQDVVYTLNNIQKPEMDLQQDKAGSIQTIRIGYMGNEARGRTSDFGYSTLSGAGDIYRTSTEMFADILLDLPHGESLDFVRIWGYDSDVNFNMTFFLFERCLPFNAAGNVNSIDLGEVSSSGSPGNFTLLINLTTEGITINNFECTYTLRTRFNTTGSSLRLYKVRAQLDSFQQPG